MILKIAGKFIFVFVVRLCFGKTSLASVEMGEARAGPPVCNSEVGGSASLLTLKLQRELVLSVCGQRCSGRGVGVYLPPGFGFL